MSQAVGSFFINHGLKAGQDTFIGIFATNCPEVNKSMSRFVLHVVSRVLLHVVSRGKTRESQCYLILNFF